MVPPDTLPRTAAATAAATATSAASAGRPRPRAGASRPVVLVALALGVVMAIALSLLLGSNLIDAGAVVRALVDPADDPGAVVWGSRVPRTVLGLMVGACLGIAG